MKPPTPKRRLMHCPECGVAFTPTHHLQMFCCKPHQHVFHDRNATRGKILLPIAQMARKMKNGKTAARSYALMQFNALMDQFNREDREAGRRPDLIVARKQRELWMAADRLS